MMRQAALVCLAAFFLFPCFSYAADMNVVADRALSGDEIALKDGRVLRLAGIKALSTDSQNLQALVAGRELAFHDAVGDRYNRVVAVATISGQNQTLEDEMLRDGQAFVYPASGDDARLDQWLKEEQAARAAKAGLWRDHPDIAPDDAESLYGKYGFVSGTVVKAERVKNKLYLNFGADWRTDFTIAIAAHDLRAFKNQDIDLRSLAGRKVRVRGWVKRDFGPMITITDPHQLELL